MKQLDPQSLDHAFLHPATPFFSDLMEWIAADESIAPTRRRDLLSGLRRVAKALGRAPEQIPCDARWLQPRLSKVRPQMHGLTVKSWQNALSDARAAMARAGIVTRRANRIEDLSPAWRALWAAVLASGDMTLQPALRRFVHFLSRRGISPEEVSDEDAAAYRDALAQNEISKSPETAWRAAVNSWNLAGRRIPAWPKTRLSLPRRQKKVVLPEAQFPESFRKDLERLTRAMERPDPFGDGPWRRPLRPATIRQYRRQLLRFASEIVHAGTDITAIDSVARLLDPALAERGLREMLTRSGGQITRSIAETAGLLRALARRLDLPEGSIQAIERLAARLRVPAPSGLTEKNRQRLRTLQDPAAQRALLQLPERLFARAGTRDGSHAACLMREDALAIGLLLFCPLRIGTLAATDLELNLQRPGDGRGFLAFGADETKTERPIEFEVPGDLLRAMDRHLARRSPALCPPGTRWLFPRRDGLGPVNPNQLSARLRRRIRRETGLEMNSHLFRHFAVMLWLDANPGAYEAARRLLGHSAASHTINMYSGLESTSAMRAYAELVTTRKGGQR